MAQYEFVNPYNFIPLTKTKKIREKKDEELLSGVIRYSVLTKTPLFIPNTSCSQALIRPGETEEAVDPEHKSYEFFAYEDLSGLKVSRKDPVCRPVITGSEIRGMLRSYYEILTESCLSGLDEEAVLSKRTNENFKAGLLRRNNDGTYDLYQAEDCLWRTKGKNSQEDEKEWKGEYYNRQCYIQDDFPEGCEVFFDKIERTEIINRRLNRYKTLAQNVTKTNSLEKKKTKGYLIKGESGPEVKFRGNPNHGRPPAQKHNSHIFCCTTQGKPVAKNISMDSLLTVLEEYRKNKEHLYEEYSSSLNMFLKGKGNEYFPVYYDMIPGTAAKLMLSPACITREIYGNTLGKLAKTFKACSDKENLCQACSLFGTVGDRFAVASRLRFSDLECSSEKDLHEIYDPVVTLLPLSSPKLNNMEFYVQRPAADAWFWTYDYYVDKNGHIHPCTPELAGRKFYWHQKTVSLPQNIEKTKLNMTIRPVASGISFRGSVYFDKITEKELQQLIWILESGDESHVELEEKKYGYKLGSAKPLGLGSIASAVDEVLIRKIQKEEESIEYKVSPYNRKKEYELFSPEVVDDFHKMTDFDAVAGEKVSYPGLQSGESTEGFLWFVGNHKGYNYKKKEPVGMPKSRLQMMYDKYLEAMTPGLLSISGESGNRKNKSHGQEIQSGGKNGQTRNTENGFVKGRKYMAFVKGKSKSGKSLNIEVNGVRASLPHFKTGGLGLDSFTPGEMIEVVFDEEKVFADGNVIKQFRIE